MNSYWDYLEHHGIDKQKWGVRNGPPYPLKPSEHSAAELKANPELRKKVLAEKEYTKTQRKALKLAGKAEIQTRTAKNAEDKFHAKETSINRLATAVKSNDKLYETQQKYNVLMTNMPPKERKEVEAIINKYSDAIVKTTLTEKEIEAGRQFINAIGVSAGIGTVLFGIPSGIGSGIGTAAINAINYSKNAKVGAYK